MASSTPTAPLMTRPVVGSMVGSFIAGPLAKKPSRENFRARFGIGLEPGLADGRTDNTLRGRVALDRAIDVADRRLNIAVERREIGAGIARRQKEQAVV